MSFHAASAVLILLLALTGCAHKPPDLTPEITKVWQADQAQVVLGQVWYSVKGLNAIQKCDPAPSTVCAPLLADALTREINHAIRAALLAIHAFPQGWKVTADAALDGVKKALTTHGQAQYAGYVDSARLLLLLIK